MFRKTTISGHVLRITEMLHASSVLGLTLCSSVVSNLCKRDTANGGFKGENEVRVGRVN